MKTKLTIEQKKEYKHLESLLNSGLIELYEYNERLIKLVGEDNIKTIQVFNGSLTADPFPYNNTVNVCQIK